MTKLEEIAVVVGEGELRHHFLLRSAGTMIKENPPRFILGSGKVGVTKCHLHGVGVGLRCSEVGLVGDLLGWNRLGCIASMVQLEVIKGNIIVIIRNIAAATGCGCWN